MGITILFKEKFSDQQGAVVNVTTAIDFDENKSVKELIDKLIPNVNELNEQKIEIYKNKEVK